MTKKNSAIVFERIALIGIGLIGSSIARRVKRDGLANHISVSARSQKSIDKAIELEFSDTATLSHQDCVKNADLIIICSPVGAYSNIIQNIKSDLKPGAIITDVGSVKQAVIRDLEPHIPEGVHLVPAHPVAGTERSGPEAGFPELFDERWCIITPTTQTNKGSLNKVTKFWQSLGSNIEIMEPKHHDLVMAMTSHLPHLIAYTIVGTATDLEKSLTNEVIKFSAGGFRDFTRIAASDPTMWRDVFLNNRDAVLEMLQRFSEDITALQRAIRWGEGDTLHELFSRTQEVRRGVIEAKQEKMYD
jgi:cyclohexadieny/prephenate dehydrogenase